MSENKTILTTRRFERWWRKVQAWFATQFASIKVALTPVEDKIDEVKETAAKETTSQEIKELILQVLRNVEHTE